MLEGRHHQPSVENQFGLMRFLPEVDRAIGELLHTKAKIFIAITGAGAGITQLIWRVPGISQILIGTSFPYHRRKFQRFIGREFEGPYVSREAAIALSLASYERVISAEDPSSSLPIGIGLTATVATLSNPSSESRVVIVARTSSKMTVVSAIMERGYLGRTSEGGISDLLTLNMILHLAGVRQISLPDFHLTSESILEKDGKFILNPKEELLDQG